MEISPARVSVKATTTEKLGFVGRGEGCEVYAVVLLGRYDEVFD
jgi:2-C-methyl-D-erythritol 2,4-cyclodiphosphate synthase